MKLSDLINDLPDVNDGAGQMNILGLSVDSRTVAPGTLFFAIPGTRVDGAAFAPAAVNNGACAVVAGVAAEFPQELGVPVIRVADVRRTLALAAARFFRTQPATSVAITGTNGKTSIAEFARQIFACLGRDAASLGTIGVVRGGETAYGGLTTPDPIALHGALAKMAAEGVTHLALEASSHGLEQRRLDGVELRAAAFNNLGHDHLDYHPTMEAYLQAKLRLFDTLLEVGRPVVVNCDGARHEAVLEVARRRGHRLITTGRDGATLKLLSAEASGTHQRVVVRGERGVYELDIALIGDYQVSNALVAAGLAMASGEGEGEVLAALAKLRGVIGRLEIVGRHNGGAVVIDYAHKPDALEAALKALRPFAPSRLICVFGCGGDRDRAKRAIMGRISAELADLTIVTDDNPRSEDAAAIRAEILAAGEGAREIGDRGEAINAALSLMQSGDLVLIAGKGHETGQIVGDQVYPFSDHEVVRKFLDEAGQ